MLKVYILYLYEMIEQRIWIYSEKNQNSGSFWGGNEDWLTQENKSK